MAKQHDIVVPELIKIKIKDNIEILKNLLTEDKDFLQLLMNEIIYMSDLSFPEHVDKIVMNHYTDIIKSCHEQYISYPKEITQIRDSVSDLAYLAKGIDQLTFKYLNELNPNYSSDDALFLGQLCRKEIYEKYTGNINSLDLSCFALKIVNIEDIELEYIGESEEDW